MDEANATWHAVYYSDLQSPFALLVIPLAFLAWRAAVPPDPARAIVPAAAPFVGWMTLFFAVATMVDPISTGPLLRTEALAGSFAATLIPFFFVLLGDLRVLWLALGVARPELSVGQNFTHALIVSLIVPVAAGASYALARWIFPDLHGQALWMLYEAGFLVLCLYASRKIVPRALPNTPARAGYVRALLGFSAAYYALWLVADFFIVVAGLDLGWAIRIVPNQLYYSFWVPFAYFRFFSREPTGAASNAGVEFRTQGNAPLGPSRSD